MYANVGRLKLTEIPGAKTLQLAVFGGLPFVVGKECNETDLYVIFLPDGQLGEVFANHHDLIDRGLDKNGKKLGGYFGKNRKVRSIKLMKGQVTSVGFVMPLSCLEPWGDISKLKEGDEVDTFNGTDIAHKFLVRGKKFNVGNLKVNQPKVNFSEHSDTKQFYQKVQEIELGSLLTITLKLHGCVKRGTMVDTLEYGNIPIERIVENKLPVHVLSYNPFTHTKEYVAVDDWYYKPTTDDWYEVELENGTTLTITGDNPVWLPEMGCYRQVCELVVGDHLLST